jgi:5,10-methylenetetrahydrofolate reductase
MTDEEIIKAITDKIRNHEVRVAIISGILGVVTLAGIFHAIHLNHALLSR